MLSSRVAELVEQPISVGTPHGVLNESGTDRYSIAYFHSPNPAAIIECLPSCVSADNPAKYPPAVYRDLVLEFYRANYFHQKGHRSAAAMVQAGGWHRHEIRRQPWEIGWCAVL